MKPARLGILIASVLALPAIAAAAYVLNSRASDPERPGPLTLSKRVDLIRERHLPDIALTDQDGRKVHFYDDVVAGKVVAINFMYASCTKTCEISSQNMARLQDELKGRTDVAMYSISLDPEHDSPAAIKAYREKHGARAGWTFLTASSVADLTLLRRKLGVYEPDPILDTDLSKHTGMVVLGNEPKGRWTMVPSLVHPIRIRQAIDRLILPPEQWPRGQAAVEEVPREDSAVSLRR